MATIVNFQDENNWESVGQYTWTKQVNDFTIQPTIPRVQFPFVVTANAAIIQVECLAPDNSENWNWAGTVYILSSTAIGAGNLADTILFSKKVFLHRFNLLIVPDYNDYFAIEYSPPRWFNQVQMSVWAYIGDGKPDYGAKLDSIATNLDILLQP